MVACDECGFWQHTVRIPAAAVCTNSLQSLTLLDFQACQDKWDQVFTRMEGRGDICCYCYNAWPSPDPESGYVQIAEGDDVQN